MEQFVGGIVNVGREVNEFRRDPITGRTVIISTARDARPNQFQATDAGPLVSQTSTNDTEATDSSSDCQFCASQRVTPPLLAAYRENETLEPNADADYDSLENTDWLVCVVPNLYPSLSTVESSSSGDSSGEFIAPIAFESVAAQGLHEVVIESPTHVTRCSQLTEQHVRLMLHAYRDRMRSIAKEASIKYVQVIKNSGELAGASIQHTHSQIFALPFVPEQVQRELDGAASYFAEHGECVFCHVIRHESRLPANEPSRVVAETDSFIAWCPHASRVAFEIHLAPKRHLSQFEQTTDDLLKELGAFLRAVLGCVDRHPRIKAFNYLLHSLPFDNKRNDQYHWHIEIIPRIAKQAGFEWGTDVNINTVAPERAAEELRASFECLD